MSAHGTLYLLPVPLHENSGLAHIPQHNLEIVHRLNCFIAEDAKVARKHLKLFGYKDLNVQILLLNEHTSAESYLTLLQPLLDGRNVGLMSDAGCPGVADPGAGLIQLCHRREVRVVPLSGPSSILFSVMASGFNGQSFAFNGYLPVDRNERVKKLRSLELLAGKSRQAQYFIETPYRNEQMWEALMKSLMDDTLLFLGCNLTANDEFICTRTVADWRKKGMPELHRCPVVFGIFR